MVRAEAETRYETGALGGGQGRRTRSTVLSSCAGRTTGWRAVLADLEFRRGVRISDFKNW